MARPLLHSTEGGLQDVRIVVIALAGVLGLGVAGFAGRPATGAARVDAADPQQTDRPERRSDGVRRLRERANERRTLTGWTRGPRGFATYYAQLFDGRRTASGTRFDNDALLAAHPHYPFGTLVRVTNLRNGRTVTVTIVDRGPVRRARASGVIIDLSRAAAEELDFIEAGRTRVRLDIREPEEDDDAA